MSKLALLSAGLLAVIGCGGASAPAAGATASGSSASAPVPLVFPIHGAGPQNGAITGSVTIQRRADDSSFTITIDLRGMNPNTTHVSHIHKGSCANNGPIAIPLPNSLQADASGRATATNEISGNYSGDGFYANVHTGPDLSSAVNAAPCACGDIFNQAR